METLLAVYMINSSTEDLGSRFEKQQLVDRDGMFWLITDRDYNDYMHNEQILIKEETLAWIDKCIEESEKKWSSHFKAKDALFAHFGQYADKLDVEYATMANSDDPDTEYKLHRDNGYLVIDTVLKISGYSAGTAYRRIISDDDAQTWLSETVETTKNNKAVSLTMTTAGRVLYPDIAKTLERV